MIKFFRKYNKRILAIVTVFLMVAFVGGSALSSFLQPRPGGQIIGQVYGKPVTQADQNDFESQTNILTGLVFQGVYLPWQRPWGTFDQSMAPLNEIDYLLLIREAEAKGAEPSLEQARIYLQSRGKNLTKFRLDNKISSDRLELAVANFMMIEQLWQTAQRSMAASELEIRQEVRNQYETVNASIVAIQSTPFANNQEPVTKKVQEAHFEKYKEQTPNYTSLEFGYRIPDRVQVEYIKINTSDIEPHKPITETVARRYWQEHRNEFRRPETTEEDQENSDSDELVGPLEESEPPLKIKSPYYQRFEEAREVVFQTLQEANQLEEARALAESIRRRLIEPWYGRSEGTDGYLEPDENVTSEDYYAQIVEEALSDSPHYSEVIKLSKTGLFSVNQATEQEAIGNSREDTQSSSGGKRFSELSHNVQGLVDKSQVAYALRDLYIALYQTASIPMIDEDNNLYLFRVIKSEKGHAPERLEEVGDQVITDIHKLRAFEEAKSHAEKIAAGVSQAGLKAAWDSYDEIPQEQKAEAGSWFETESFAKLNQELIPGLRFPVTVRDKAGNPDNLIRSDEFVSEVFKLLESSGDQALGVIEVPELEKCFVVQLNGVNHISTDRYDQYKSIVQNSLLRSRADALKKDWFSSDRIRARVGFTRER